jgi:Asp-tRNA(Asn)/Glu-tRNA(Gln) amidotransferase A subunit family amidase
MLTILAFFTQASTQRFASGKPLSLFDGVPVAVKDELDVANYATTGITSVLSTLNCV